MSRNLRILVAIIALATLLVASATRDWQNVGPKMQAPIPNAKELFWHS